MKSLRDEIPHTWDEIRLDGGGVDLISSKLYLDFICLWQISSRSDFVLPIIFKILTKKLAHVTINKNSVKVH